MGSVKAVVGVGVGPPGGPQRLTSVAQQKLVEMAQPLQARELGGPVGVLAQNPQHAHQLPDLFEVLFWLWQENRGTPDGRTEPRSPQPSTTSSNGSPQIVWECWDLGLGKIEGGGQTTQKSREIIFSCNI